MKSGKYSDIYLNRSLSTTDVLPGSRLRSDIIGKRLDGAFDIFDYASKGQAGGSPLILLENHVDFYNDLSNVFLAKLIQW